MVFNSEDLFYSLYQHYTDRLYKKLAELPGGTRLATIIASMK